MMALGEELRKIRTEAGLTAAKAKMDRSYVRDVERGSASPSVEVLFRLCHALGVRASAVLARVEGEQSNRKR